MKSFTKKKTYREYEEDSNQHINQDETIFEKVTRTFTNKQLRLTQHHKIINILNEQIRRPQTSNQMKKDYRNLKNLMVCNRIVMESRKKSILSYKKMRNINSQCESKKAYEPLFKEIQNTQYNLVKKKKQKYDLEKLQNYMETQQSKQEDPLENLVETTLYQGMRDIKNYVPRQAKLGKKIALFGAMMEEQKCRHIQKIKQLLIKQKQKMPNITLSYQIYLINHYLISQLMMKIYEDFSAFQLRKKHEEIYLQIKNQMVSEIIHEKSFAHILKIIDEHLSNKEQQNFVQAAAVVRQKSALFDCRSRLKERKRTKHQRHGSDRYIQAMARQNQGKGKEGEIAFQFQKLYLQAEQNINQAQLQLNFPVSPRKTNFHSVIY